VSQTRPTHLAHEPRRLEFWPGKSGDVDVNVLAASAIRVKGISSPFPLRFLELYLNGQGATQRHFLPEGVRSRYATWRMIEDSFLPRACGATLRIGDDIPQPPFAWREADPFELGLSFTYNTNAFFRILRNLREAGLVDASDTTKLLDDACVLLGELYKANEHFLIRNINNNLNMYLIPKVVEYLVGRTCYDANQQELATTRGAVQQALVLAAQRRHLPILDKMKLALGMGVSFVEARLRHGELACSDLEEVERSSHRFDNATIAIDHRTHLLGMISDAGHHQHGFTLGVILDDAAESVDDLLWIQDLVQQYPFLRVHLLVNSLQVSVNFSAQLMQQIWQARVFHELASRRGSQVFLTKIDFPLISFQTNYLPQPAWRVVDNSDAVYIKGANFFETCQLREKETFYAFVVFGQMSRRYSGLNDFDGVFAHVPAGSVGYLHSPAGRPPITLRQVAPNADRPSPAVE
jgi:hypothetical protein